MSEHKVSFEFIETPEDLQSFYQIHQDVDWICFDTEFIGEKRYYTLLCLIQVASDHGFFLIDPLQLEDLTPFLKLITDPKIEKITHAGENDYRILYEQFNVLPVNTFDTQVAASFVGYKYPVSFARLVEGELRIRLSKGFAVTDWQARPFKPQQLKYAINDVKYLRELSQKLKQKLTYRERLEWVKDESAQMEEPEMYYRDPHKDALSSNLIYNLKDKEKIFLIRLHAWRNEEARKKNYSREMILPNKLINTVVRAIHSGLKALESNRRISSKVVRKYGELFMQLYEPPPTEEEKAVLESIPKRRVEDPRHEIVMEMLDLLIRYKCLDEGIAPNIVMPRNLLNKLKSDLDYFDPMLEKSWRKEFLGEELVHWLEHRHHLEIEFHKGRFELRFEGE